jgi:hypothetical protein
MVRTIFVFDAPKSTKALRHLNADMPIMGV